jgi:hypothetical protein
MSERTERRSATRQSYRLKGPLVCAQCGAVSGPGAPSWVDEPEDEPEGGAPMDDAGCAPLSSANEELASPSIKLLVSPGRHFAAEVGRPG